ncbi:MAG: hypothetical protein A2928_00905 [Candidatus Taylorbacteria bacterium RIFCSPLOWO2_01_FULL_45_15b]|uniref:Peptidoglycan binding-like domain-containing protein n=1 Tax=Candidatus Taylorbacteria bacterium RIFCSPLOWO2_01_FULL_45_15b TaxID=1802319 RepID=A0A1G2N7U5_9BACT|nr:MAG: hypothetical protein A2928_00905 [Candidatus Taylorbacteria bacterium RIFCSPLOWO2_01_FULL_45_15b]
MKPEYKIALFTFLFIALLFPQKSNAALFVEMEVGSSGDSVVELQQYLALDPSIYPEGLVTGYFGSLTRSAVMRFQARYEISQVGRVGPITLAVLNELMIGGGTGGSDDEYAPIISDVKVTNTGSMALVSWKTSEAATTKVYYTPRYPLTYETSLVLNPPIDYIGNHSILIPNLENRTYFYIVESEDIAGNVSVTTPKVLR